MLPMPQMLPDLFIRPEFDAARAVAHFTVPAGCSVATWKVTDGHDTVAEGSTGIEPGTEAALVIPLQGFKPWHVTSPNLYHLHLRLHGQGTEIQEVETFGMRKIQITREGLFVNNQPFYVRGYIRGREAHDHPNLENLPLEEYYAKNIRMAKRYGFNFIRFHSCVPPEECFRVADRLGIFIHVEMRKYYGKYQKERKLMMDEGQLLDENDWIAMVKKLRNHPSLMVYCMGNEIDHPGRNPRCKYFYDLTRSLDPTRLFLDTCSRGEFDRQSVDLDVQHMSYFYPFGRNYGMFEDTQNWIIYGAADPTLQMISQDAEDGYTWKIMRRIPSPRPVLAHEIAHYVALRDVYELRRKFERSGAAMPWWIDELIKLIRLKGHEKNYPLLLEASRRFQFLGWKLTIEAARRSPVLSGFHFLQLSDTDRYENANGILDCFDDPKGTDENAFLAFNGDSVILADLPRRTYFEREEVRIPIIVSHFSQQYGGLADLSFTLESREGKAVAMGGSLEKIDLEERGRREIAHLVVRLPRVARPEALVFTLTLRGRNQPYTIENKWNLWLYPDRPHELPPLEATIALDEVRLAARYPQIEATGSLEKPARLLIVNRFSARVIKHLAAGGDVLMLYRVPVTRDRKRRASREPYYLPATWDRFKAVIWDRGHNCGAFVRPSAALAGFPNDGFMDLQFYGIVDDCDKVILDDFPVPVEPIVEGVDKATRDRFDVYTYKLSELQPAYTMRRFGYLFELRVGKGRLLVSGFNLTGVNTGVPEACAMFESLVRYVTSDAFQPAARIAPHNLERYLLEKGKGPIVKERRMTQFWQLDEEPLESKRYWRESLEYLDDKPVELDTWLFKEQERKV